MHIMIHHYRLLIMNSQINSNHVRSLNHVFPESKTVYYCRNWVEEKLPTKAHFYFRQTWLNEQTRGSFPNPWHHQFQHLKRHPLPKVVLDAQLQPRW